MAKLNTDPNLADPDAFYESLIAMHHGLSDEQSVLANAKLVLLLANHVGDPEVLQQAIGIARSDAAAAMRIKEGDERGFADT